jgi:regulatory protein
MTYSEVLEKLKYYCAYQERAHSDVYQKLWDFKLDEEERNNIIASLIGENYLNEERFAIAYSEGKFRMKKWGKTKIKMKLKEKKVSPYCLEKGLKAIDEDEYLETLTSLVNKKFSSINESNIYKKKLKTVNYCYQKGFESELIWKAINQITQE